MTTTQQVYPFCENSHIQKSNGNKKKVVGSLDNNISSIRYEPPLIDLANKNDSHVLMIDLAGTNKNILEVGTSTGYVTRILKEKDNEITGIEIDPEAARIAEKYCTRMITGDIEKLDLDNLLSRSSFDVIILGDVLEHLVNPQDILKKLKKFLKRDGYLVISLPNFCHGDVIFNVLNGDFHYTDVGLLDRTHLRFFGLRNIYTLFAQTGYQISGLLTTQCDIGKTELGLHKKIPDELHAFIESLPASGIYQYIFTAHPSDNPEIPAAGDFSFGSRFEQIENKIYHKRDTEVAQLEQRLNDSLSKNVDLESVNAGLNAKNSDLESVNAGLNKRVADLNTLVTVHGKQIQKLTDSNLLIQQENDSLKRSITYKATQKFHRNVVERFFRPESRRRRYYDLCLDGGRILVNEGWASFRARCKKKIREQGPGAGERSYRQWIDRNESEYLDTRRVETDIRSFPVQPKFSIVVPVWEVEDRWLTLMIESVLNQLYRNWELCIVDAGSKKPHIRKILTDYQKRDPRIKVKFLGKNGGISENTNEALQMAEGDFIGFLDHDDELAPFALYEVAKYINTHPDCSLIYSDEDKIHPDGTRSDPFFKPDWAPDQFLSQNYICHFSVIRQELLKKAGLLRKEFDGSQDYDLLLRVTENIKKNEIGHIQKILYHWRMIPSSTSYSIGAKPVAIVSSKKAIQEALDRRQIKAKVTDGIIQDTYRVRYEIRGRPLVSIIIPTRDHARDLERCITSVVNKTTYDNYEIIIINNNSQEPETAEFFSRVQKDTRIRVIEYNREFNFSAINNYAVSRSGGEILLFLNNDTEVITEEWLTSMVEHAQRREVGAVGAKLLYPDNTIQHAGVVLGIGPAGSAVGGHSHKYAAAGIPGYFSSLNIIRNYSAVTAACLMMRRAVFYEVGGFDEKLKIAFNDVDLCMKIRSAGYSIVYTPYAELYHMESKSRGYENTPEKTKRFNDEIQYFRSKWSTEINQTDPFYNRNLTHRREDFSLNVSD